VGGTLEYLPLALAEIRLRQPPEIQIGGMGLEFVPPVDPCNIFHVFRQDMPFVFRQNAMQDSVQFINPRFVEESHGAIAISKAGQVDARKVPARLPGTLNDDDIGQRMMFFDEQRSEDSAHASANNNDVSAAECGRIAPLWIMKVLHIVFS